MAVNATTLHPFDFEYLYNHTHSLPLLHEYLVQPFSNKSILSITYDGCVATVGNAISYYTGKDVYDRVILWKLPLLALWATTTLPPFSFHTQLFTLIHLIADPVDTIWSLLYRLDLAKRTARWVKDRDENKNKEKKLSYIFSFGSYKRAGQADRDQAALMDRINKKLADKKRGPLLRRYFQDVPAMIITTYDEWGKGDEATEIIESGFENVNSDHIKRFELREICRKAAFVIASDRVSRFLPSSASALVFLIQLTASFWKTLVTLGNTYEGSNPMSAGLNRTPHNIAFGTLFFWLPFAVLLTALIGGSQTSHLIPRVLADFQKDFAHKSNKQEDIFPIISPEIDKRWSSGGLPVWQIAKYKDRTTVHRAFFWLAISLSVAVVAIPTGCAIAISWQTPTEGVGCRVLVQLGFFVAWIASAALSWVLQNNYCLTFVKDFVFMALTIVALTFTSLGVLNSCVCWCQWRYISFLQDDYIFQKIKVRLGSTFPGIVGLAFSTQFIIFFATWIYFRNGYRVLKQQDIDAVLDPRESVSEKLRRNWRWTSSYLLRYEPVPQNSS